MHLCGNVFSVSFKSWFELILKFEKRTGENTAFRLGSASVKFKRFLYLDKCFPHSFWPVCTFIFPLHASLHIVGLIIMNRCPCCSETLLRHARHGTVYWFCTHCWQEMPDLAMGMEAKRTDHLVSSLRELMSTATHR